MKRASDKQIAAVLRQQVGIVAEKAHSNFVAAVTGTVPPANRLCWWRIGQPSPSPHPKVLGPAFQSGGAFFLRRALSSPCGTLAGHDERWFWRRKHHQLGSYLGRSQSELA
jgi:hypothetical protein